MSQYTSHPQGSEASGRDMRVRLSELANQFWTRGKSRALAVIEGIELSDAQWDVIVFLRKYYLHVGLPMHARITAGALNSHFSRLGGNKYLHRLFSGGPVTQGSRLARLPTPAYATDPSFGSSY